MAPLTQVKAPILVLGPAYSGKSELAMQLLAPDATAIVIGTAPPHEPAFAPRLTQLRGLRPPTWETLDSPTDLTAALQDSAARTSQILVDSISQWLATLVVHGEGHGEAAKADAVEARLEELCRALTATPECRFVLVSAEVGASPAPPRPGERLYRQLVGQANRRLAAVARTVLLVHAGIPLMIKEAREG